MRGAIIVSKRDDLFSDLSRHFASRARHGSILDPMSGSACINSEGKDRLMFYDHKPEDDDFAQRHEIPEAILNQGYKYVYLVECRCKSLFCDIVGSTSREFDILILDDNEGVFRPSELRPDTLYL
jgi:hypothetical protein